MGHASSLPEKVHHAVAKNNLQKLETLCNEFQQSVYDQQQVQEVLEWQDKDGRNALMLAAARNYLDIALLLLRKGANSNTMTSTVKEMSGSALHEAVIHRHEAMVALLLEHGASPFVANEVGSTPMHAAVEAAHSGIMIRLQGKALFRGMAMVRVNRALRSAAFKPRHIVVMPQYTQKEPGTQRPGTHIALWAFKAANFTTPRTRLWLDGATVVRSSPTKLELHLHPRHVEPFGVSTHYDNGYIVSLQAISDDRDHIAILAAITAVCGESFVFPPPPPGAILSLRDQDSQQLPSSTPQIPRSLADGSVLAPSTPSQADLQLEERSQRGEGARLWGGSDDHYSTPQRTSRRSTSEPPAGAGNPFSSPIRGVDESGLIMRLASSASAGVMHTPNSLSAPGAQPSTPRVSPPPLPPPPAFLLSLEPQHNSPTTQPLLAGSDSETAIPISPNNPFRTQILYSNSDSHFSSGGGDGMVSAASASLYNQVFDGSTSSGSSPRSNMFLTAGAPPMHEALAQFFPATSPLYAPYVGNGHFKRPPAVQVKPVPPKTADDESCVICLVSPKSSGFLHGTTVHKCVCSACAPLVRVGWPCPLCRAPVEKVLGVF